MEPTNRRFDILRNLAYEIAESDDRFKRRMATIVVNKLGAKGFLDVDTVSGIRHSELTRLGFNEGTKAREFVEALISECGQIVSGEGCVDTEWPPVENQRYSDLAGARVRLVVAKLCANKALDYLTLALGHISEVVGIDSGSEMDRYRPNKSIFDLPTVTSSCMSALTCANILSRLLDDTLRHTPECK